MGTEKKLAVGAGIGTPISVMFIYVLGLFGLEVPPAVVGAITGFATTALAYWWK